MIMIQAIQQAQMLNLITNTRPYTFDIMSSRPVDHYWHGCCYALFFLSRSSMNFSVQLYLSYDSFVPIIVQNK